MPFDTSRLPWTTSPSRRNSAWSGTFATFMKAMARFVLSIWRLRPQQARCPVKTSGFVCPSSYLPPLQCDQGCRRFLTNRQAKSIVQFPYRLADQRALPGSQALTDCTLAAQMRPVRRLSPQFARRPRNRCSPLRQTSVSRTSSERCTYGSIIAPNGSLPWPQQSTASRAGTASM